MQAKSHGLPVSDFNMQSSCSTSSSSSAVLSCLNSMNSKTSIQSQPHGSSSTMPPFAMFLSETVRYRIVQIYVTESVNTMFLYLDAGRCDRGSVEYVRYGQYNGR